MNKYMNEEGLMNPFSGDIVSENCPLTTVVYLKLFGMLIPHLTHNQRMSEQGGVRLIRRNLNKWIKESKEETGLYHQKPKRLNPDNHDAYMSKDQLIAYCAYMWDNGQFDKVKEIRDYLKRHWFTYNNLKNGKIRIMGIKGTLFPFALCGNRLARYILIKSCYASCREFAKNNKDKATGAQKAYVILDTLNLKNTYHKAIKYCGGWDRVFVNYYKEQDHPIRDIIRDIIRRLYFGE